METINSHENAIENKKLKALLEIASSLNSNVQVEHLLPFIMISATDLLDAEASSLFLLDNKHNNLFCEVAIGEKGTLIKKYLKLDVGEGIAGWVAENKQSLLIEDAYKDKRFDSTWDKKSGFETKSVICIPLYVKERVVGTLEVINKKSGGVFTDTDQMLLEYLGNIAAVALDNARLHSSLQVKVRELSLMTKMEQKIAAGWNIDRLLNWVLNEFIEVVDARGGSVFLFDENSRNITLSCSAGFISQQIDSNTFLPDSGILALSILEERPVLIKNIHADQRFRGQPILPHESSSMLCAPLQWQGEIFGFILINDKNDGYVFTRKDLDSLSNVAERLAVLQKTASAFNQIKKSSQEENAARQLMEKILPKSAPNHERLSIYSKYIPYNQIGGDFYRFLDLGKGKTGILIVDVSGHGLSAAIISVMVNTMLQAISLQQLQNPSEFFLALNNNIKGRLGGNFLTAFYCVIDSEIEKITCANAGHTEGVYYRSSDDSFLSINAKGPLLGVWPEPVFEEVSYDLRSGDKILLYTDGLIELMGDDNMLIVDEDDLKNMVRENHKETAKNISIKIINDIKSRAHISEFQDDVTLLMLDYK